MFAKFSGQERDVHRYTRVPTTTRQTQRALNKLCSPKRVCIHDAGHGIGARSLVALETSFAGSRNEYIGRRAEPNGIKQKRRQAKPSFNVLILSLQGFQSGKDSRAAEVSRDDARGAFAQLRLGDQLPELPGCYSRRHLQAPLLDQQRSSAWN